MEAQRISAVVMLAAVAFTAPARGDADADDLGERTAVFDLYIAHMHQRLHRQWADGFLRVIDSVKPTPLADPTLATTLEISIKPSGQIDRMGIIKPSGITAFDIAALDAIQKAAPFGPTPPEIRSYNGDVYLDWTLYRDARDCNPGHTRAFILAKRP